MFELVGCHTIVAKFVNGFLGFGQPLKAHGTQYLRCFAELDGGVVDEFDAITPGVKEIHEWSRQQADAELFEFVEHEVAIVYDQPEVTPIIASLLSARGKIQKLIAQVDKRHAVTAAA